MSHIVVIGAGQAGASLVGKLRAEGFEGDITLLGAEDGPPYQRPALSKAYLLGEMERERLFLRPRDWYEGNDINLRTGTRAVAVDPASKTVTLEGGEMLNYDHLAFTTGSHPRTLPASIGGALDGVYTVRDLADADAMTPEFVEGALRSFWWKWQTAFCNVSRPPKRPSISATCTRFMASTFAKGSGLTD